MEKASDVWKVTPILTNKPRCLDDYIYNTSRLQDQVSL